MRTNSIYHTYINTTCQRPVDICSKNMTATWYAMWRRLALTIITMGEHVAHKKEKKKPKKNAKK